MENDDGRERPLTRRPCQISDQWRARSSFEHLPALLRDAGLKWRWQHRRTFKLHLLAAICARDIEVACDTKTKAGQPNNSFQ